MTRCIIFCAGEFDGKLEPTLPDDYILAADGGLCYVNQLNLVPNGILGDFDSLGYIPQDSQVFPVEKDDTDTMLAIKKGLELGYDSFLLYASLDGKRLDHTVANFQSLKYLADRGKVGFLLGKDYITTVISNGFITFSKDCTGIVSAFCLGADAQGVTIAGLQYPLQQGNLSAGFPLGVSNHFIGKSGKISVENGSILILYDRKNGLPEEVQCSPMN